MGGPTGPNANPKVIAGRPWTVSRWSFIKHMIDFQLIQDGLRYVQLHEETLFSFIQIEWHDWLAYPDGQKKMAIPPYI